MTCFSTLSHPVFGKMAYNVFCHGISVLITGGADGVLLITDSSGIIHLAAETKECLMCLEPGIRYYLFLHLR
jgi:hypothetical protein